VFLTAPAVSGKFKVTGEKLFFGNREVSIKGAVLIFAAFSPSGKYVAILSADGPRKGSLMPFFGGGQKLKGPTLSPVIFLVNGEPISDVLKTSIHYGKRGVSCLLVYR